jgi:ribosomal protein L7/L12
MTGKEESMEENGSAPSHLQFEKVDPPAVSAPAGACSACKGPLTGAYFAVNRRPICATCKDGILAATTGGSGSRRFVRALGFGLAGAAVGSGIYFAVLALTGYELGLVAILVGWIVGVAVKKGSDGRGGWAYQLLAIALTYTAIVTTYIPLIVRELTAGETSKRHYQVSVGDLGDNRDTVIREIHAATGLGLAKVKALIDQRAPIEHLTKPAAEALARKITGLGADAVVKDSLDGDEQPGRADLALALAMLLALAAVVPFLAGPENILGWIIIAVALYEAWKQNRRTQLEITGPFQVATPAAGAT